MKSKLCESSWVADPKIGPRIDTLRQRPRHDLLIQGIVTTYQHNSAGR